jgi:hypothetical protein
MWGWMIKTEGCPKRYSGTLHDEFNKIESFLKR